MRNPQTDPKPGDVLTKTIHGWPYTRIVCELIDQDVWWRGTGIERPCSLRSWRAWAKSAEVVK